MQYQPTRIKLSYRVTNMKMRKCISHAHIIKLRVN